MKRKKKTKKAAKKKNKPTRKKKKGTKKKKTVKRKKVKSSKKKKKKATRKAKKSVRKSVKRPKAPPAPEPEVDGILLGRVEDFFAQVNVVALVLEAPLSVGETIRVKSENTDFTQVVTSMQIDHQPVTTAAKGASVGIRVNERAHRDNRVYKVAAVW